MSRVLPAASIALVCAACSRTGLEVPDARPELTDARPELHDAQPMRADAVVEICEARVIELGTLEPTIAFVIDGSGSMDRPFVAADGRVATRWQVLVDVLTGDPTGAGGILAEFERRARLGGTTFFNDRGEICPSVLWVPPETRNAARFGAYLRGQEPRGGTPTAEALTFVTGVLTEGADHRGGASVMVLATDGVPTGCGDGVDAPAESVEAVRVARARGLETRVLSVGTETARAHLQELADAGSGLDGAPFYVATDEVALSRALDEIVGDAVSCRARLPNRAWSAEGCHLEVHVGDVEAECASIHGFDVQGEVLVLHGLACDRAESGEPVRVGLPCR